MDIIEQRNKLIENGEFIKFKYPYQQFYIGDLVSFHLISDVKTFYKQKVIAVISSKINNNDLLVENDIVLENFFDKEIFYRVQKKNKSKKLKIVYDFELTRQKDKYKILEKHFKKNRCALKIVT
ncbi:hypothetical protein DBY21_02210 [Candidatus Gastranaerophilales bacterium]|nr:MAG: hypothetical protein DBY21_02210 [Candidatus Gastranaerophilales bacterium]